MTAVLFALLLQDDPSKLIGEYAQLDLDSKARGERPEIVFDDASRKRILLEHRIVACEKPALKPLIEALKHESRHVRAMAAELLGVLGDKAAATALAAAAKDSDPTVRIYATQSLAWIHAGTEAIDAGMKDSNRNVQFIAQRAREQLKETTRIREAYADLKDSDLSGVEVGRKTPDFTLPSADGKSWKLSAQKGVVVLMFQLADWWPSWTNQMAQLRRKEKEFAAVGAQIVCVVGLDPVRTRYFQKNKPGPYRALSDVSRRVAAQYGVAKQLLVHDEWVNAPSVFILKDGVLVWKHVGKSWGDRPEADTILQEAKKAGGK